MANAEENEKRDGCKSWFPIHCPEKGSKDVETVKAQNVPEKGSNDVETENAQDVTDNSKATKASAIEVTDEVCKDSEYDLRTNDEPDAESIAVEIPTKPQQIRGQRSLGGIDYYTVTYDDPTDEDEDNY